MRRALANGAWTLLLLLCAALAQAAATPRNVIILFADGAAATQWELGRQASRHLRDAPFLTTDVVMREGTVGLMSTAPADALVTDSAAAASAMSTGHKTDNGRIAVLPDGRPVETLMEAAKAAGKRIGLVTTTAVHDASPAAFTVHARSRRDAAALVDRYLAFEPDVLMGGGRAHFLPRGEDGGRRTDGRDVAALFRAKGYAYVTDAAGVAAVGSGRVLGLFAEGDMALEIDRDVRVQPSLADMTAAALRTLSGDAPAGFVLFVENEGVDTAGHRNDIAALLRELWAFDAAVAVALDFRRAHPDTLILITGDHETGGLSVTNALRDLTALTAANRFYATREHLEMIARIDVSLDRAAKLIRGGVPVDEVIARHFPGYTLDEDLRRAIETRRPLERNFSYTIHSALSRMVSRQTAIYWGTTGHTGEPVVVGALGPGAERFGGYADNTDFALRVKALLGPRRAPQAASR